MLPSFSDRIGKLHQHHTRHHLMEMRAWLTDWPGLAEADAWGELHRCQNMCHLPPMETRNVTCIWLMTRVAWKLGQSPGCQASCGPWNKASSWNTVLACLLHVMPFMWHDLFLHWEAYIIVECMQSVHSQELLQIHAIVHEQLHKVNSVLDQSGKHGFIQIQALKTTQSQSQLLSTMALSNHQHRAGVRSSRRLGLRLKVRRKNTKIAATAQPANSAKTAGLTCHCVLFSMLKISCLATSQRFQANAKFSWDCALDLLAAEDNKTITLEGQLPLRMNSSPATHTAGCQVS